MQMYPHKGAFPPMGAPSNLVPNNMPIVGDNQWMSQSAYQNIDLDKVDWAALAQQWIHMKESCGTEDTIPNAPPPPRFSNTATDYEEQGEAPMEVEHEDEQTSQVNESVVANVTKPPPPPTNIFQTNNWNTEPNQRGQHPKHWNRSKLHKRQGIFFYQANGMFTSEGKRWNSSNPNHSKSQRMQSNDGYAAPGQVFNSAKQPSVWSSGTPTNSANPFARKPNVNEMKVDGLDANVSGIQLDQLGLNAMPSLDAAQRKTLPAWIR